MKKSFFILIGFLLITYINSNAAENSRYILKGETRINGNIYSSDFSQIGDFKNCCPKYESAFGFAPAILVGGEVRNVFNLFGYNVNYSLMLGYNDLSAAYSVRQHIGNDLGVDSYERILVDHDLAIGYSLINTEHSFWFNPVKELPLGLKLGVNIGIPISKNFDQKEQLITPKDATFPDGSRIFNPAKDDIPNASAIFSALSIGARYKIFDFSKFDLFANAAFSYSLSGISPDLDLNIHQASLGISLHYNVPKPEPPRPLAPPPPPPPTPQAPPIARKPDIQLITDFDYKRVKSGDTLEVVIDKHEYVTFASLMPVLVFEKNSAKVLPLKINSSKKGNLYDVTFNAYQELDFPNNYPKIIKEHLEFNKFAKFKIIAQTDDEDSDILKTRLQLISDNLVSAGIDKNLFTTEILATKSQKEKNPLLLEESRKVFFDFSGDGGLIDVKVSTDYLVGNFNKVMNITPILSAEDTASFTGKTLFNRSNETALKMGTNQVVLASGMFVSKNEVHNIFEVFSEISDSEGQKVSASSIFYLKHKEKKIRTYYNLNKNVSDSEIEEFIISFSHFDKEDFYLVNKFAIDYIYSKSQEGRTLEIIPLTDNIGTPEYNQNLARKRAEKAIKLLGKNLGPYEIIIPDYEVFSNETPYGRMMNRAVIIRIK